MSNPPEKCLKCGGSDFRNKGCGYNKVQGLYYRWYCKSCGHKMRTDAR